MAARAALLTAGLAAAGGIGCEPPVDPVAAGLQPVPAAAPAEPEPAEEPQIFGYLAPEPLGFHVRRQGATVNVGVAWRPVDRAPRYQVQLSRSLTFGRTVFDRSTKDSHITARRLRPGVYFWRARAVGPEGEGVFSPVAVIDATRNGQGQTTSGAARAAAAPAASEAAEAPAEAAAAAPRQALQLVWRAPAHQTIVHAMRVSLEGEATAGALVRVNGGAPVAVNGAFTLPIELRHGRNQVELVAVLGDQQQRLVRDLYGVDVARLGPLRVRFERLQRELGEIRGLRLELAATVRELEHRRRAPGAAGADVAGLHEELQVIEQARTELDQEVAAAIGELDRMLAP